MRVVQCSIRRSISSITIVFAELADVTGVELLGFEAYEQTNYALLVTAGIDPRTGQLSLRVTGDPAVLTATQAREYANSFVRVLAAIVRSPERAIDVAGNELAARDVAQLISEQAAATPDATALVTDTASWTYAELDRGAERIAAGLLTAGMPPGARVGVMLDRSPELIATVLGVLKAGAAVVPLDPSYPRARIDAMIDRARPFRVISDIAEVRALLEAPATTTLPAIDPESAAYVLFTSGSTGEPKGVTMPHRALAQPHRMAEPAPVRRRRPFDAAVLPAVLRRVVSGSLFDALRWRRRCGWCPRRSARICRRWCALSRTRESNAYFCPASRCRHSPRQRTSPERRWSRCAS